MYRYLFTTIFLFFSIHVIYADSNLDDLLIELDEIVQNRQVYAEAKEKDIYTLRQQLTVAGSDEQQFMLLKELFELYANYQTDSAYVVAKQRIQLANKLGDKKSIALSKMNLVEVYRTTGLYKEALDLLEDLRSEKLQTYDYAYFYHLYHSLYILMADYAVLTSDKKDYNQLLFAYKDSLLNTLHKDDMSYDLVLSSYYLMQGNYSEALNITLASYNKYGDDSPLINYTLAEIYRHLGEQEEEAIYLAKSAIADLKNGVREYISLYQLAHILFDRGDVVRAYSYIKCAMEDAVFSNSRLRTLEISKILPLINKVYDIQMRGQHRTLLLILSITLILFSVLVVAIYYIYRQMRQLSEAKNKQNALNKNLIAVNKQLSELNIRLSESDHVKEEYIGHLFNVCSSYISKLEDFRLLVKRNLQTGQAKQLSQMVDDNSLVTDELKEFYKQFDTMFLKIYPSFIKGFNELMTPDGVILPKDGDLLTPELRIFALIRLGITDSVKIAEFLHYSPQTIYNYRLKVRNKAKASKDEFLEQVQRLGQE